MTPAYTALNLDSGVGEQVATIGGQYGILLTVLYDRDWILDTVETFHPNVSESAVVELFGAALPCIADAMSDDLRDLLKDNGAARMRDDVHILYGQNTDVDGHELLKTNLFGMSFLQLLPRAAVPTSPTPKPLFRNGSTMIAPTCIVTPRTRKTCL